MGKTVPPQAVRGTSRRRKTLTPGYSANAVGADIDFDAMEFGRAMDQWKRDNRKPFPTFADVLAVAKSLGYVKAGKKRKPKWPWKGQGPVGC